MDWYTQKRIADWTYRCIAYSLMFTGLVFSFVLLHVFGAAAYLAFCVWLHVRKGTTHGK